MAVTTYTNYAVQTPLASLVRAGENFLRFNCTTEAELPSANLLDGDRAYTEDSGKRWVRQGGAWVVQTTDNLATSIMESSGPTVLPIGSVADGGYLKRVGLTVVGATASGVWGAITGTLGDQADLVAAANLRALKTANLSDLADIPTARTNLGLGTLATQSGTFSGTSSGTNTGDQTAASLGLGNVTNTSDANKPVSTAQQAALDAKQATLVSGTNLKTVNGSTLLGAGNLAVTASDPSYTPGTFTVSTGTGRLFIQRVQLLTTERATVAGTARLRVA